MCDYAAMYGIRTINEASRWFGLLAAQPKSQKVSKVNGGAPQRNLFRNDKNAGVIQFPRFVYLQEGSYINSILIMPRMWC